MGRSLLELNSFAETDAQVTVSRQSEQHTDTLRWARATGTWSGMRRSGRCPFTTDVDDDDDDFCLLIQVYAIF